MRVAIYRDSKGLAVLMGGDGGGDKREIRGDNAAPASLITDKEN